jgi:hypothetical protein
MYNCYSIYRYIPERYYSVLPLVLQPFISLDGFQMANKMFVKEKFLAESPLPSQNAVIAWISRQQRIGVLPLSVLWIRIPLIRIRMWIRIRLITLLRIWMRIRILIFI